MTDEFDLTMASGFVTPGRRKNKWNATVAPTTGDDSGDAYEIGSIWVDVTNDKAYIAVDVSVGAAVWYQFAPGGTPAEITDIPTAETDDTLVLAPDGAGGVEFRAETGGSGIASGTSFPGSPSTGDLFHRTDLSPNLWRYDGTRWRCTCVHEASSGAETAAASLLVGLLAFDEAGQDIWAIDAVFGSAVISGTHDGSNHYTVEIYKMNADGSGGTGTAIASTTTHAIGTGTINLAAVDVPIGAVVDVSATPVISFLAIEVGATGTARLIWTFRYQYIAT